MTMHRFWIGVMLLGVVAGSAVAQSVSVPVTAPPTIRRVAPPTAPLPPADGVLPFAPVVQQPPRDPALVAFENKRAALLATDYQGMARLGAESLRCPAARSFQPAVRLDPRLITEARALLRTAAEKGVANAQLALARSYLEGKCGSPVDLVEGYAWFKTAFTGNPNVTRDVNMDYANRFLTPDIKQDAEYRAYLYVQKFSRPFGVAARVVPEIPCPDSRNQVGVFLAGDDFDLSRTAIRLYSGKGYPTMHQDVRTLQGCTRSRELNRFRVRFAANATVFYINNFLRENKYCIVGMLPDARSSDTSVEQLDFTDVILAGAEPPATVADSDRMIVLIKRSGVFQNAVPSYAGAESCPSAR